MSAPSNRDGSSGYRPEAPKQQQTGPPGLSRGAQDRPPVAFSASLLPGQMQPGIPYHQQVYQQQLQQQQQQRMNQQHAGPGGVPGLLGLMGGSAAAHFGQFGYQTSVTGQYMGMPPPSGFPSRGMPASGAAPGDSRATSKAIESEIAQLVGIQQNPQQSGGRRPDGSTGAAAFYRHGGGMGPPSPQKFRQQPQPIPHFHHLLPQNLQVGPQRSQQMKAPASPGASDMWGGTPISGKEPANSEQMVPQQKNEEASVPNARVDKPNEQREQGGKKGKAKQKKGKKKKQRAEPEEVVITYPPANPGLKGTFVSARAKRILGRCPRITPDAVDRVTTGVLRLHETLRPPPNDLQRKADFVQRLQAIVTAAFPDTGAEIHMFGSSANDFCLKRGDLDMCLSINAEASERPAIITKLAKILQARKMQDIQPLPKARIPIVKFIDPKKKLSCDICINNMLALENTRLLGLYASIDPRMRQLVFTVKRWAKQRDINDCYMGTLSSYAYVLMVIHFLQIQDPPILPCLQVAADGSALPEKLIQGFNCAYRDDLENLVGYGEANIMSVGALLIEFFKFYAFLFDYQECVVSVRTAGFLTKSAKGWTQSKPRVCCLLTIEDPFEVTHNLGRSVDKSGLKIIRDEFERAYTMIAKTGNLWEVLEQYDNSDNTTAS